MGGEQSFCFGVKMPTFFVSAITMDHINFENDVRLVDKLGVDGLHIDVMDGHFVPRFGIYPEIIDRISDISSLPLDMHMMVDDIFFSLGQFSHNKNIKFVRFHVEACAGNEMRAIDEIKKIGASPIACINLATGFHVLERMVKNNEIDGVMLMGIHPGVLIQEARPQNIINDLVDLKQMIKGSSAEAHIGLDGAINFSTLPELLAAGVNNFIGGSSSIFRDTPATMSQHDRIEKISQNWSEIRKLIGKED
jgi:ribulose-phosphate 3-epimerase